MCVCVCVCVSSTFVLFLVSLSVRILHVRRMLCVMNVVREGERHKTCCPPIPSLLYGYLIGSFRGKGVRGVPPRLNFPHPLLQLPGRIPEKQGLGGCRGKVACEWQPYCHTLSGNCYNWNISAGNRTVTSVFFPLYEKGSAVRFVIFVFVFGSASFVSFLQFFRVGVWNKCSGTNFCCWASMFVLCVFDGVLPKFLFYVLGLRSRRCSKKIS